MLKIMENYEKDFDQEKFNMEEIPVLEDEIKIRISLEENGIIIAKGEVSSFEEAEMELGLLEKFYEKKKRERELGEILEQQKEEKDND